MSYQKDKLGSCDYPSKKPPKCPSTVEWINKSRYTHSRVWYSNENEWAALWEKTVGRYCWELGDPFRSDYCHLGKRSWWLGPDQSSQQFVASWTLSHPISWYNLDIWQLHFKVHVQKERRTQQKAIQFKNLASIPQIIPLFCTGFYCLLKFRLIRESFKLIKPPG